MNAFGLILGLFIMIFCIVSIIKSIKNIKHKSDEKKKLKEKSDNVSIEGNDNPSK